MQPQVVPPASDEFAGVEYIMQMQLDAPMFKISEMRDVSCRHQKKSFDDYKRRKEQVNVVDTFVLLKSVQQPLSDIAAHGLRIAANTGFKFQLDSISLPPGQETYDVLHVKVVLGSVINYQNYEAELDETKYLSSVPTADDLKGHDSVRVGPDNTFYVFNQAQVSVEHLVSFKGGKNLEHAQNIINKCGVCGKTNATLYCENDGIKLCKDCDAKTHNSNPLFQAHIRIPLRDSLPKTQVCQFHPDQKCQYYCQRCHLGVCVDCKVNGNHAHGESSKHKLIPLAQAYTEAHALVNATNSTYVTREKMIKEGIAEAEERLRDIMDNSDAVEKEIQRIAREAIASLKQQAQNRAVIVKSAKIELERKLAQLDKLKEYIKIQDETAEPNDFLKAFASAKQLEEEMKIGKDLPLPPNVYGNLVVYGKLEVSDPRPAISDTQTSTMDEENQAGFVRARELPSQMSDEASESQSAATETTESQVMLEKAPKFSRLSKIAARKQEKLNIANTPLNFTPFKGSEILLDDDEKKMLYLTLPFKGVPETHLMFSTTRDGKSINKMHRMIDDKGITLVVVRANGYIFGGFAASKWNSDGVPFGDQSSCFLFSLSNDAFIPARGQSEEQCKLFATEDTLTFGKDDLRIAGNFQQCSSHLENTYGVGLAYGGSKAATFLAGAPDFVADLVEVWGFFSSE